jgi:hypothetical protein
MRSWQQQHFSVQRLTALVILTLSLITAILTQSSSAQLAYLGDHEVYLSELFARRYANFPRATDQCDSTCIPSTIVFEAELGNFGQKARAIVVFFEIIDIDTREIIFSAQEKRTISEDSWLDVLSPWNPTEKEVAAERYELKAIVYDDSEKSQQLSRVARAPLILSPVPEPDDNNTYHVAITELYAYQPRDSVFSEMILASELRNYLNISQSFLVHFEVIDAITGEIVFSDDESGALEPESFTHVAAGTRWTPAELDGNYVVQATVYSNLQKSEKLSRAERMPIFIGSTDIPEGSLQYDIAVSELAVKREHDSTSNIETCDDCVSSMIFLTTELKNSLGSDQPFAIYLDIKDLTAVTVFNAYQTGTMNANSTSEVGISWIPAEAGRYELRAIVFNDLQNTERMSNLQRTPILIT